MPKLACPHCNYTKELPEVPLQAQITKCPKCNNSFKLSDPSNFRTEGQFIPRPNMNPDKEPLLSNNIYCKRCNYLNDVTNAICYQCGASLITPSEPLQHGYSGAEILAVIYMWLCYLPYIVALIGAVAVSNAIGEDKLVIILYAYVIAAIFIFNLIVGIPIMLMNYRIELKLKVKTTYLVCVMLPIICFLALFLKGK